MVKKPPANAGDLDLIPGLGRSPGGGPRTEETGGLQSKCCRELDTTEAT